MKNDIEIIIMHLPTVDSIFLLVLLCNNHWLTA